MAETKTEIRRAPRFELIAGNVCLDLINTLDNRPTAEPKELLRTYNDLVHFAEDAGMLSQREADYLIERSPVAQEEKRISLEKTIEMREAMYAVFMAIAEKRSVPAHALAVLNAYIRESAGHARLVQDLKQADKFAWRFDPVTSIDGIRWPIAREAADLLASDQLPMVRTCSASACQWLFLDTSKNHHRRWCSMKICGNRTKVRKFYAKRKEM